MQDALGLLAQATDALNGITTYQRDPFGNLSQVTDPKGNVVQITYDRLGRRTDLRDPDLGWTHYDSDPLGRVWRQQSPKQRSAGQFTTFQFDALDRMTLRSEPDLTSTWVYDTAARGTGQLAEAYTGTPTNKDYRRVHGYDSLGRPSTTTITLDTSYVSTTHYDAQGRLSRLSHQRGTGPVKAYDHLYNPLGYLHRIERAGVGLWQASEQDAAQRVTVALLGNGLTDRQSFNPYSARLTAATVDVAPGQSRLIEGYTYDELGNVKQRTQWWDGSGFSESFDYDGLNRLKSAQVTGRALHSFGYDEIGNLISKSGTGSGNYVYPASGANAVRPHAVQSIPGLGSYGYDTNGNLTSAPSGAVLTWKSFDMPDTITRGGVSSQFAYGPEHQRGRQTRSDGTVLYYAGAMEVETKAGATTVKTYWPLGLGVEIDKPAQSTEMLWTHSDRLGSVIGLTNSAGAFKEKLAYDAWGKRRTLDGASTPNTLDGQADNRGFTGHEMLDNLDMVHMNGRIYEPAIARFLSADPLIQDPEHSQSYNRYSYVWNNPTNLTDPTGFAAAMGQSQRNHTNKPVIYVKDFNGIKTEDVDKIEIRTNADGSKTVSVIMKNGSTLAQNYTSSSLENAMARTEQAPTVKQRAGSLALDVIPVVGAVKSFGQLISGTDLITGEETNRAVEAGGILLGLVPGGKLLSRAEKGLELGIDVVKGCCCFPEGTPVLTETGMQPIEQIQVGHKVYARDPKTGKTGLKPVTQLMHTEGKALYELSLQSRNGSVSTLQVTDNHPFWVNKKGWVESAKLRPGMKLEDFNKSLVSVVRVTPLKRIEKTYNFTVDGYHTYFAGDARAFVHNECACALAAKGGAASAKQAADLSKHLGYIEKYGKGGVKELENGRIRYYGEVQPANKAGEMAGRRYVHEYDATTGRSRGWHETVDQAGNVRQVRPELNNGSKIHYQFDRNGNYTGSW